MRRSRRIYKRKSRSNLETLIILIGAIVILSVAFYMAREKSFLPPEEMESEQQIFFEEEIVKESRSDQKAIEELAAQSSPVSERPIEQATLEQSRPAEGEKIEQLTEQAAQGEDAGVESQTVPESTKQEEVMGVIEQPIVSGTVYTVQVGYFSVESNARSLATEIGKHGFQTVVLQHNNAFKVQVGAYQEREQAERASVELKRLGYDIWITQR